MAKTSAKSGAKAGTGTKGNSSSSSPPENKKSFEQRLDRLEALGETIRKVDIPLGEALKAFEEGIRLAQSLEKDLEKIESRIELLMNNPNAGADEDPELGLFDGRENGNF